MVDNIFIKKIYINDYILNTKLLDETINNTLLYVLSKNVYRSMDINIKVNNLVDKINLLYKKSDTQSVFNLAYQPFNEYNIHYSYYKNKYTKKWIIPIINQQKTLFINSATFNKKTNKIEKIFFIQNKETINDNGSIKYIDIDTSTDITYPNNNYFLDINNTQLKLYDTTLLIEPPWNKKKDELVFNETFQLINSIKSNLVYNITNNTVVIKKAFNNEKIYYITDEQIKGKDNIIEYKKIIKEALYETLNILENQEINIQQFLIINPIKLLNTNYNIFLGNCISYLNEIINSTYIYINDIIQNNDTTTEFKVTPQYTDEHIILDHSDFFSSHKSSENNFILNYLNIIKTYKNFQSIKINETETYSVYSIRALKYIYSLYGYDLNKIPNCYIVYLQEILDTNIRSFILNNTITTIQFIKKYKSYINKQILTDTPFANNILNLYNITTITTTTTDEELYNTIYNTSDKGLFYYFNNYVQYINNIQQSTLTNLESSTLVENECDAYKICKSYSSMELYEYKLQFYKPIYFDLNYSQNVYLILYDDVVKNLYYPTGEFNNTIYQANYKNNKPTNITQIDLADSVIEDLFSEENKYYIYDLVYFNINIDTVFNKLLHFKYLSNYYLIFPTEKLTEISNLIQIDNDLFNYNIKTQTLSPFKHTNQKCKYNQIHNKFINKSYQLQTYNHDFIENTNEYYNDINIKQANMDEYKEQILIKSNNYKNNILFKNFLLYKPIPKAPFNIIISDLEPLEFNIYSSSYLTTNFIEYILKYNLDESTIKTYTQTGLYDILKESPYTTSYTKDITRFGNSMQGKNETPSKEISRYLNDFEFIQFVSDTRNTSRAYYKITELLAHTDILLKKDIKVLSLAEAPGHFVSAIKNIIQKTNSNWDNCDIFTLLSHEEFTSQNNFFTTFKTNIYKPNESFDGNLTNTDNIDLYTQEHLNDKADLITADGGLDKSEDIDYKLEELHHIPLFLAEIITAILNQKIHGTFIIKMFNIIDINSFNLLYILTSFYETVSILKPYTSRPHNSEKYVFCKNFKGIPPQHFDTIKTTLYSILNRIKDISLGTWPTFSTDPVPYFNILPNITYDPKFESKKTHFNSSSIMKTQAFYLGNIINILKSPKHYSLFFIKKYFSKNSKAVLTTLLDSESGDIGYFINKIHSCIKLCMYINEPIKQKYINLLGIIKNKNKCILDDECFIYPPHFKLKNDIDTSPNELDRHTSIGKFISKYCISFNINNIDQQLHYKLTILVENFIYNSYINNIDHILIHKIKQHIDDIKTLHPYLLEICKITDIAKLFYLYSDNIISIIIKFQNNIRYILGWYICKYTYIPLYPKYKIESDPVKQVELYGVLLKNSQYICYFSGDKLDVEEFDDFMGNTLHRTNLSLFDNNNSVDTVLLQSINLSWNNNLNNIYQNIALFIIDAFTNSIAQYENFVITDNIKYNIIKNYSLFDLKLKSNISSNKSILAFINLFLDTIYHKEIEGMSLYHDNPTTPAEKKDMTKWAKLLHPVNTFLKKKNLQKIYELKQQDPHLEKIYKEYIEPGINACAEYTSKSENSIPIYVARSYRYSTTKKINDTFKTLFIDLYSKVLFSTHIENNFNNIILYTITLLFYNLYEYDIKQLTSNIEKTIIPFFNNIMNKLIHKIYQSNNLYFDQVIKNISTPYNDAIFIENSSSKIYKDNKTLSIHLTDKWSILYQLTPINQQIFDETYKNKKIHLLLLLQDNYIVKVNSNILIDTISRLTSTSAYKFSLELLRNPKYSIYFNDINTFEEQLLSDFDSSEEEEKEEEQNMEKINKHLIDNINTIIKYVSDKVLFNDKITIINSINITNNPLSQDTNIFHKKSNISTLIPNPSSYINNQTNSILYNTYLNNITQYLLLHVYETVNKNNEKIPQYFNQKRLFYMPNTIEFCKYTNYSKIEILHNITKQTSNDLTILYKNLINLNKTPLNNIEYISHNKIDDIEYTSIISIFNNTTYYINSTDIQFITKFINNFILQNPQDSILKNIHILYDSDPIHYTIYFLENYKDQFIEYLNTPDIIPYNPKILNIINTKIIKLIPFLEPLKLLYIDNPFDPTIDIQLNDQITHLHNTIKPFISNIDLINLDHINIHSIILLFNNIKQELSNIINLYTDYSIQPHSIIKNRYKSIKKYFTDYDFNLLTKISTNNKFDLSMINNENHTNIQIIFTEILNQFSCDINNIYSTNIDLANKLLYYKLLNSIHESIIKLLSKDAFNNNIKNANYWNYINNIIISKNLNSISSIVIPDDSYMQLFIKIILHSINNILSYSELIHIYNSNSYNIDYNNEDDIHNTSHEYEPVDEFEDGIELDQEEL